MARIEDEIIRAEDKLLQLDIDIDLLDLSVKDLKILYEQYLIALSENANNEITHTDFLTVPPGLSRPFLSPSSLQLRKTASPYLRGKKGAALPPALPHPVHTAKRRCVPPSHCSAV